MTVTVDDPMLVIEMSDMDGYKLVLDFFELVDLSILTETLVSEKLTAGNYKYVFDATGLASGVYYYQLSADLGTKFSKKLIYLK